RANPPSAAAVTPATNATPNNTDHTCARRESARAGEVMRPGYGVAATALSGRLVAQLAPTPFPGPELVVRVPVDLVHVLEDAAQLVAEGLAPLMEVGGGLEQMLVGRHLPGGGEQQRRHRLVALHPPLGDVLPA